MIPFYFGHDNENTFFNFGNDSDAQHIILSFYLVWKISNIFKLCETFV